MHKFLLTVSTVLDLAGAAQAADLPVRSAVPAPVPVFVGMNWTGLYGGIVTGGVFGRTSVFQIPNNITNTTNTNGLTVELVAGYTLQFDSIVIGAEIGAYVQSHTGQSSFVSVLGNNFSQQVEQPWGARGRVRLGYTFDKTLFFVAGGGSFDETKVSLSRLSGAPLGTFSNSKSRVGWNLGAGEDYAFTNNWIGRVEYIYDKFSPQTYTYNVTVTNVADRRVRSENHNIRVGLLYLFNSRPAAVVAKF